MKARQLPPLVIAIMAIFVFGGCRRTKAVGPVAEEELERVVVILRKSGKDTLRHQNDAALKAAIAKRVNVSNSIQSLEDLARHGRGVSVNEILDAAPREQPLRNKIIGELNGIARDIDSSDAIDLGAAVVEAHCDGLKQELATGEQSTAMDYTVYLALALVKRQIPTPPDMQIGEVAEDLVKIAKELYASTINDEAARRAYVKEICKIP